MDQDDKGRTALYHVVWALTGQGYTIFENDCPWALRLERIASLLLRKGGSTMASKLNPEFRDGKSLFETALGWGLEPVAVLMIELGIPYRTEQPPYFGSWAHLAAAWNLRKLIAALFDQGEDFNTRDNEGRTPIHIAITHTPKYSTISALLASGADPRMQDYQGRTVLHHFKNTYDIEEDEDKRIARLLIENGADPAARDGGGKPAVQYIRGDAEEARY
jgi:ankyrin repeat protein